MNHSDSSTPKNSTKSVSRRQFVKAAGASATAVGLAGCVSTGGGSSGSSGDSTEEPIDTSEPTEEVTVSWAVGPREKNRRDEVVAALRSAGLSENIELEMLAGSNLTDNRQSRYTQWLSSGRETPDLLQFDSGWTIPFILREQLANLSNVLPEEMLTDVEENYFSASVQTASHPETGDLYGVPLFPDFPTIQYRKDLLREAGYGDSDFQTWATESMSWAEFSQVTKQAMEANPDVQYGFSFQANAYEGLSCCDFNEFMTSWGGAYFGDPSQYLFGPIGDRPVTVDEQPVVDSIRMVRTFIHGEDDPEGIGGDFAGNIAPEAVLQWTEESSRKPFTNGDAIMHRNWPYSIGINGAEDAFGEDLGVMPIPYGVTADEAEYPMTGGPVAALGGWHNALNPNSQNKSAAVQVMRTMMEPEFQLEMFDLLGYTPPRTDLFGSDRAREVAPYGRYMEQLRIAGENAIPRPVTTIWPTQSIRIARRVNESYAQERTPQEAMTRLKEELEGTEESA
ncbi:sugar ABC transporter substrate-binding protein [Salinigranum rubrum]|uniref:Sugar ABC transporter substrate-binding protein n=1 Tax=Salinigranum rubrum TaxID=755307 RepID=A0A2I8VFS2_9EURY|nr:substrate-binding domain-containing protein [Salinigranum rubrum]AUV80776.1 sugar ABC transporter substrate-binding protein [Salinigranum rubrum]